MRTLLFVMVLGLTLFTGMPPGASAQERAPIEAVIMALMTGIDQQDGPAIASALHENAAMRATNPDGTDVVAVSAADFAELHASGRFGGQAREVQIEGLHIDDGLVANARVTASNASVHYTYYLGLVRIGGAWKIHTFLQRSRPQS